MSLMIYIARHGDAAFNSTDCERVLTPFGIKQAKALNRYLKNEAKITSFTKVFVSPYKRAQMTCDLMLEGIDAAEKETESMLIPSGNYLNFIEYLKIECADLTEGNILIVSHLPLVNYLTLELTDKNIMFNTCTMVKITSDGEDFNASSLKIAQIIEQKTD